MQQLLKRKKMQRLLKRKKIQRLKEKEIQRLKITTSFKTEDIDNKK
jgi:hypothetical protein